MGGTRTTAVIAATGAASATDAAGAAKVYISTGLVTSEFCAALGDKAYDVTWKELRARGAGGIRAW